MKNKVPLSEWWIWQFCRSGLFVCFLLFFGFFISLAFISQCRKNNRKVQVMKEDVLYIRPSGFEEVPDTLKID